MSILVADSGSTKTDWRLADHSGKISQFRTQGYNPYQWSEDEIAESLRNELVSQFSENSPEEIFFYGAGCGNDEKRSVVRNALLKIFPKSKVEINSDLLGSARALCARGEGIIAILGTGSNSCCYNGEKITDNRPSLGYILGDEGSGAVIGKLFLQKYLTDMLDVKLKANFERRFSLSTAEILDKIYRKPLPNRFLASFSKFVFQNIEHQQCADLVVENFRSFFDVHILRYRQARSWPLHVTGSVGFYFSNLLRRVSEENNVRLGVIVESPISGLMNYHLEK